MKTKPSQTTQDLAALGIDPSDLFAEVYQKLSETERREIDRIRENLEVSIPVFGPMRSAELIIKLALFMTRGGIKP